MKKLLLTAAAFVLTMTADAQGVVFRDITLAHALGTAASEGKPVLLDCYTVWCAPCRRMDAEVFPLTEVGDYVNPRFIAIKMDVLQSDEGPGVRERYSVHAYPTYLVIAPDGELIHAVVGYREAAQFIASLEEAFNEEKSLGGMRRRFEDGEREPKFLTAYMQALKSAHNNEVVEIAEVLFPMLDDEEKTSPDYQIIGGMYTAPIGYEMERYFLANIDRYRKALGREKVDAMASHQYTIQLAMLMRGDYAVAAEELDRVGAGIEAATLTDTPKLLTYVSLIRLLYAGERDAEPYRQASAGIGLDLTSFVSLFSKLKESLTPVQLYEWRVWGAEIAAVQQDERSREWVLHLISEGA